VLGKVGIDEDPASADFRARQSTGTRAQTHFLRMKLQELGRLFER
jgi:hypothetical protein